jgi:hypothetical protein
MREEDVIVRVDGYALVRGVGCWGCAFLKPEDDGCSKFGGFACLQAESAGWVKETQNTSREAR